jgi:hypothetical protein
MTMLAELKFSEARNQFTTVVDRAQRFEIPVIRPRKKSEDFSVIVRGELLKSLLAKEQEREFKVKIINETDGSTTVTVAPFAIAVNAPTSEAAISQTVAEVIDYAQEYMGAENFRLYFNSPNRHSHLVLVTKILLCASPDQVQAILGLG